MTFRGNHFYVNAHAALPQHGVSGSVSEKPRINLHTTCPANIASESENLPKEYHGVQFSRSSTDHPPKIIMAGHSKWSKVKHIKGVLDVRRGKLFSKLSKEITVAAKLGGGNPAFNPRLRAAIQAAKDQSMPADNIERAIKKGTGELASAALEEITYEGYGSGGVAVMLEAATDNKNRTAADLRTIFSRNDGNLASSGSVAYLFHRRGSLVVPASAASEDQLLEILLEAGAEEFQNEAGQYVIWTPPDRLFAVSEAISQAGLPVAEQKLTFLAASPLLLAEEESARKALKLCDALEDCDDVLQVHANFEVPDELLEKLSA